jgi:hypothetical protein
MVEFEMYPAGVKIFLTAGGNVKLTCCATYIIQTA